jgi:hypothetical protein
MGGRRATGSIRRVMKPLHSPAGRCDGAGDAGGLNFSAVSSFFLAPDALNPPGTTVEIPHGFRG